MTQSRYSYNTLYGVEPFKNVAGVDLSSSPYGGGAENTGKNLLVSLWLYDNPGHFSPLPTSGKLLQQLPVQLLSGTSNAPLSILTPIDSSAEKAYEQVFDSRTSFKIVLGDLGDGNESPLPVLPSLLGAMNPPGELKNYYMNIAKAVLNSSSYGFDLNTKKGSFEWMCWESLFANMFALTAIPGIGIVGGATYSPLPLLKTSGADGVFPEFYTGLYEALNFTPHNAAGLVDAMKNIADGKFFIPVVIGPETPAVNTLWSAKISWPFSAMRGT